MLDVDITLDTLQTFNNIRLRKSVELNVNLPVRLYFEFIVNPNHPKNVNREGDCHIKGESSVGSTDTTAINEVKRECRSECSTQDIDAESYPSIDIEGNSCTAAVEIDPFQ